MPRPVRGIVQEGRGLPRPYKRRLRAPPPGALPGGRGKKRCAQILLLPTALSPQMKPPLLSAVFGYAHLYFQQPWQRPSVNRCRGREAEPGLLEV